MIYSLVFQGLPPEMKTRIYQNLARALNPTNPDHDFAYLPSAEKQTIRTILKITLADLPKNW